MAELCRVFKGFESPGVWIPKRFKKVDDPGGLDWLEAKYPEIVKRCLSNWKKPPSLLGRSGTGKTHLIWAMASAIESRYSEKFHDEFERQEKLIAGGGRAERPTNLIPPEIIVTSGAELAHELRASIKTESLETCIEKFRPTKKSSDYRNREHYLFIDDIEVMKMGDWIAEELYRIIDFRYAEMFPTVFVSNLSPDELRGFLGDRISRRIFDMTEALVLK